MSLIYKIANNINDKVYIGQTTRTLSLRINQHKYDSKNKIHPFYRAIRKYGWENFKVEILEEDVPLENLNERELYWTDKYNALTPNGYVCVAGGEPRIFSEETRKKISESKIEKNNPMFGVVGKLHHNSKSVLQYDLEGNFVKKFDCIMDASRELNLSHGNISSVCTGKRNKTGNYKFKYKD